MIEREEKNKTTKYIKKNVSMDEKDTHDIYLKH